jgi:hypothetical protein
VVSALGAHLSLAGDPFRHVASAKHPRKDVYSHPSARIWSSGGALDAVIGS